MTGTFSSAGSSDSYLWITSGDGAWSDPNNWQDLNTGDNPALSAPGSSDTVTLVSDPSAYLTVTGPGVAESLEVNGAIRLDGTFTTDTFEVATTGDNGGVDILGGGLVSVGTSLTVGDNSYSGAITIEPAGTLAMSGTGSVLVGGSASSSGAIVLTGSQARFNASDAFMTLGNAGTGTFSINQGATALVGGLDLGEQAGGSGTLTVAGSGSRAAVGNAVGVGRPGGTGTLKVLAGGSLSAGTVLNVGVDASGSAGSGRGSGAVIVNGAGSVLSVGTSLVAGAAARGTLGAGTAEIDVTGGGALLAGSNVVLAGAASLTLDAGSAIEIGGSTDGTAGVLRIDSDGTLAGSGTVGIAGTLNNDGRVDAAGGVLSITAATVSGGGIFAIETGATLDLSAGSVTGAIVFSGNGEVVFAQDTAGIAPTFDFSTSSGTIDFAGVDPSSVTISGSSLIIGGVGTFLLTGTLPVSASVVADGAVVVTMACFAAGTRILTAGGELAVEALREGDLVVLARSGQAVPVRWIGHRQVDCRRHPRPQDVLPVRVKAGAFGPGRPRRDLVLSPDHAVHGSALAGGPDVLVPVRYLINGATILQQAVDAITYFHVELDRHDVLLAEGLPTESYLDTGNRAAFANGGRPVMLHPGFSRRIWETQGCAPLVLEGEALAGLRRRLLERAVELGHGLTTDAGLRLEVDGVAVEPQRYGDVLYVALPDGARELALLSRSFVPAETDAAACDTRRLGVALLALALDEEPVALDGPRLRDGWHAAEGDWRWTTGAARLDVRGVSLAALRVAPVGACRYWLAVATEAARSAA